MITHFPAYRNFRAARIEAIDAMTALVIGARLNIDELELKENSSEMLPVLYPKVQGIKRLNRTAADSAQILRDGERHLANMAIPYALSVYSDFLISAITMLQEDGRKPSTITPVDDPSKLSGEIIHEYIGECCNESVSQTYLSLFQLGRRLRNRIIHNAGAPGSNIDYHNMPQEARNAWIKLASRPLSDAITKERLMLGDSELIAVLGTCNILADEVNNLVSKTISRQSWALIVINDFRESYPHKFRQRDRVLGHIAGFATSSYRPLGLTAEELEPVLKECYTAQD